jgi:acetyl-CoA C-acetyltransferase
MKDSVYVLGGAQTDFAINWSKQGGGLFEMMKEAVEKALATTTVAASDVDSSHVGNFVGELFEGQGHLGGFMASIDAGFAGKPSSRHEAACASGSIALVAAMNEILAGHAGLSCVVGVERMRNVPGKEAADHLGAAAWRGKEGQEARYLWPFMFSKLIEEYDARFGIKEAHLKAISQLAYDNARRNPLAQTRGWTLDQRHFRGDPEVDPRIEGRVFRHDCGQVTDGACAVLLASREVAEEWARKRGKTLDQVPRIAGFGHTTGHMTMGEKLDRHEPGALLFPHVEKASSDARKRAGIHSLEQLDLIELHDCFTITHYTLLEHLGLAKPGEAWRIIESGDIAIGGMLPVNPSGGLIGAGHPVGATGVRMLHDAQMQVSGIAGDYQIAGAKTAQTLNIGGSATTAVSFVVTCAH